MCVLVIMYVCVYRVSKALLDKLAHEDLQEYL